MVDFKLKEYMDTFEISIHWLHKQTGIRYATLHAMLNNKQTSVNMKHLKTILKALSISDMNVVFDVDLHK